MWSRPLLLIGSRQRKCAKPRTHEEKLPADLCAFARLRVRAHIDSRYSQTPLLTPHELLRFAYFFARCSSKTRLCRSAGLTPGMLAAWASVCGLRFSSFWRDSMLNVLSDR